ncbi:hypothetical protein D3C84_950970 [compost metagenome]
MQVTPGIDFPQVAADEVAIATKLVGSLLRHAPVALEHIGALDFDHPDLVDSQRLTRSRVGNTDRHAR